MNISAKTGSRGRLSESQRARGRGLSTQGRAAAPQALSCGRTPLPSSTTKFLIANLELEFRVIHTKQSIAPKSNRERMAISPSAFSELATRHSLALRPSTAEGAFIASIRQFLIATDDPTRIGILSDHRESKELSCGTMEILRAAEAARFLIATFDFQDFTQLAKNTALNKILIATKTTFPQFSASPSPHPFLPASVSPRLAATRPSRYNSGSHIEVNQP
jgi:hypothetical protein